MKTAAEILKRLLEGSPAGGQPSSRLFGDWQELAGTSLAEHCRVYEIRHGSLLVEADHPGWMQMLLLQKKGILARLHRRFPELELRDIKVRVNPSGQTAKPRQSRQPGQSGMARKAGEEPGEAEARGGGRKPPPGPTSAEVREALEVVRDEDLREKLRLLLQEMERRIPAPDRQREGKDEGSGGR
jgi:hypothetical protein